MSVIASLAVIARPAGFARRIHGVILIAAGLCAGLARPAHGAPRVAVFDSPTALEWLRSAGVECRAIVESELSGALAGIQLIVLPVDRIRSDAPLRSLAAFTARGGKVVAVYWGTIARSDQQAAYPVYRAASLLGIRVLGWTLTGPAIARPENPSAESIAVRDAHRAMSESAAPSGAHPSTGPSEVASEPWMMVRVEVEPAAQILA